MITNEQFIEKNYESAMKPNSWDYANSILYQLCENNPSHTSEEIIVAKIWLIGRSYAAAIERRKSIRPEEIGKDYYFEFVAPTIMGHGKEIDDRIASLKKYDFITLENIREIAETHEFLTSLFSEISGFNKRSLASKYLHFHIPQLFYIYDNRAMSMARTLSAGDNEVKSRLSKAKVDDEYKSFCCRAFEISKYVNSTFNVEMTPRQIDNMLLGNIG